MDRATQCVPIRNEAKASREMEAVVVVHVLYMGNKGHELSVPVVDQNDRTG